MSDAEFAVHDKVQYCEWNAGFHADLCVAWLNSWWPGDADHDGDFGVCGVAGFETTVGEVVGGGIDGSGGGARDAAVGGRGGDDVVDEGFETVDGVGNDVSRDFHVLY